MKFLLLLLLFFYSTFGHASQMSYFYSNILDVGLDYRSWDNREYQNGSELMRDYGTLTGFTVNSRFLFDDDRWMVEFGWNRVAGDTTYDGQLGDGTPYISDSQNVITRYDTHFVRGYDTASGIFAIHFGVGYRHLFNEEVPEDPADYSREISYSYIPIGLRFITDTSLGLKLEFDMTYNLFLSGEVKTYFAERGYSNDLLFAQNEGKGVYASATIWGDYWKVVGYMHSWSIEDSESGTATYIADGSVGEFYEPENTTKSYGIRVAVSF